MMSSGAQASESTDDWFEEDVELPGDSEYRKINEGIWKEGFRNAVTESKDVSLQKGFEDGFSRCAALSARLGELRGQFEATLKLRASDAHRVSMQNFLTELTEFSTHASKFATKDLQSPEGMLNFNKQTDLHALNVDDAVNNLIRRGMAILSKGAEKDS